MTPEKEKNIKDIIFIIKAGLMNIHFFIYLYIYLYRLLKNELRLKSLIRFRLG